MRTVISAIHLILTKLCWLLCLLSAPYALFRLTSDLATATGPLQEAAAAGTAVALVAIPYCAARALERLGPAARRGGDGRPSRQMMRWLARIERLNQNESLA